MDILQHDYYFWTLINDYVVHKGYRVLDKGEREVWLEDEGANPRRIFRIVRADLDWANALRRDVHFALKRFEYVRRQLRLNKIIGENIYVSVYPPVDSWDDIKHPMQLNGKLTVHTSIIQRRETLEHVPERDLYLPDMSTIATIEELEQKIAAKKNEIERIMMKQKEEEASLFVNGRTLATYVLLFSIALMYFQLERHGGSTSLITLINYGAKYNPLIIEGEWWRLFSAMFLHIGFLHLVMNSLALFYLGGAVERMYGTIRFLIIYFGAGLFGSLASFAFNEQVSAGASGAIFGCFGALLYFGTVHKKLFFRTMGKNVLFVLALNIVFGLTMPMVDNGAHIGGLIGGFLASALVQLPSQKKSLKQVGALFISGAAAWSLFAFGLTSNEGEMSTQLALQLGQEYIQQDEIERAYPLLQRAVEQDPTMPEAAFLLGYAEATFGNYEVAKEQFQQAVVERPDFHEAHYNLALIYFELNEVERGQEALERALELNPNNDMYKQLKEKIQTQKEG